MAETPDFEARAIELLRAQGGVPLERAGFSAWMRGTEAAIAAALKDAYLDGAVGGRPAADALSAMSCEGWKMVPVCPNAAMLEGAKLVGLPVEDAAMLYAWMLAAAPSPPLPALDGTEVGNG